MRHLAHSSVAETVKLPTIAKGGSPEFEFDEGSLTSTCQTTQRSRLRGLSHSYHRPPGARDRTNVRLVNRRLVSTTVDGDLESQSVAIERDD